MRHVSSPERIFTMNQVKKIHLLILVVLILLTPSCAPASREITGDERASVLAYSEAKTDNLLAAINDQDLAAFSQDLDAAMIKAFPEKGFQNLYNQLNDKLGSYQSRSVNSVIAQKGFIALIYLAKYEKSDVVKVRVVFRDTEPHQISGLWLDAPELR
jgi:hypothetical protein